MNSKKLQDFFFNVEREKNKNKEMENMKIYIKIDRENIEKNKKYQKKTF